jgi:RHO1 GDP-GTP exchange protein 1/2
VILWEGSPTGFGSSFFLQSTKTIPYCLYICLALHYPYVLAFEPTFVEVRHVETGLMSQVIQGSNLRLLFADTPPSTTHSGSAMHHNPYHGGAGGGYGYNSYGAPGHPPPNAYGGQPPGYGRYGGPHSPYPNRYPRNAQAAGRDEILMVSDDRILSLRTSRGRHMPSDSASMISMTR